MSMKFFLPFLFLFIASPVLALTDVVLNDPTALSSYELSLTYDDAKGTLLPPTSSTTAYRIIRAQFVQPSGSFESGFLGILIGPKEKVLQRFGIPKPGNMPTGGRVSYGVPAPYYPSGERIDIYAGSVKLFAIDLSASRLCVEDSICAFGSGESEQNCPADCTRTPPAPASTKTPPPPLPTTPGALPPRLAQKEEPIPLIGREISPMLWSFAFLALGLASFASWIVLRRKHKG
jgi:hypothetical protein